jgi:hypothetical protein
MPHWRVVMKRWRRSPLGACMGDAKQEWAAHCAYEACYALCRCCCCCCCALPLAALRGQPLCRAAPAPSVCACLQRSSAALT